MAIDQIEEKVIERPEPPDHKASFIAIFVVLALLAVGEIYSLNKQGSMEDSFKADQTAAKNAMTAQLDSRISALEDSNAKVLEAMKDQLDATTKDTGTAQKDLKHARALVAKLQQDQAAQSQQFQDELSKKADTEQVGALSGTVDNTRKDLDETKKNLDATKQDLGMTRSQFGTLIARNHDDVEYLRKLGQRNYYEFTIDRNHTQNVAGVGLILKKTNVKHHRFNLNLVADDMTIEKNNRTINEPIFFSTSGSKSFYELVVNQVQSGQIKGYISTPKMGSEVAMGSEGAQ